MNINTFHIRHIPERREIELIPCKFFFNGECQLLNIKCNNKKNKVTCEYLIQKDALY